jgi:hypothetical protein
VWARGATHAGGAQAGGDGLGGRASLRVWPRLTAWGRSSRGARTTVQGAAVAQVGVAGGGKGHRVSRVVRRDVADAHACAASAGW